MRIHPIYLPSRAGLTLILQHGVTKKRGPTGDKLADCGIALSGVAESSALSAKAEPKN